MSLWILLMSSALAHSPHDVASVLHRAEDGSLLTNDSDLLALSIDDGRSFHYRYWFDGVPACVFATSASEWIVAGSGTGVWTTVDGGRNFIASEGPSEVYACTYSDSLFVVSGSNGTWWSEDGFTWEPIGNETDWRATNLELVGNETLFATTDGGLGWRIDLEDESAVWTPIDGTDLLVIRASDSNPSDLLAGIRDGEMRFSDDGGASWTILEGSPRDIRVLAIDQDLVLAASADEAVWVSRDAGGSWEYQDDGIDELAVGNGGPADGIHYFHLLIEDDRWTLGSFEGLYWKEADDDHWSQGELDILPRVRSVAWIGEELLVGAYGGGVYRGFPGTEDWREVSRGIGWSYPKQVVSVDDTGEELWVVSGSALFHSVDAGESWDSAPVRLSEAGDMVALHPDYPDVPHLAVGGRLLTGNAAIAWSRDRGEEWVVSELPGDCRAKPRALTWDTELRVACGSTGEVYRSTDGGENFELVGIVGAEVHEILSMGSVLLATDDGIWSWEPDDALTRIALPGLPITAIAVDSENIWWFSTPSRGVGLLDDTGEIEWLDWPDGDFVEDISLSSTGAIAVALRTGAWWSTGPNEAFELANDYDRIDDRLQHWWFDGFTLEAQEDASTGYVHRGESGASAVLRFSGSQIRLLGAARSGTRVRISIDGEHVETLCWEQGRNPGLIWATDLEPGDHELGIFVEEGLLWLDGAERWRVLRPAIDTPVDEVSTETRCGCGATTDTAWFWLLISAAPWRKRRRIHEEATIESKPISGKQSSCTH